MRQIVLNISEQPGAGVQIHGIYDGHRPDATPLENKVGNVVAELVRSLLVSMEPTDLGEGANRDEAQFSIDISKDIRKAGE